MNRLDLWLYGRYVYGTILIRTLSINSAMSLLIAVFYLSSISHTRVLLNLNLALARLILEFPRIELGCSQGTCRKKESFL
jgi:hypothetical protein